MAPIDLESLVRDGLDLSFFRMAVLQNDDSGVYSAAYNYNFDMNFFPDGPETPLCIACSLGNIEIVKALVECNANIHAHPHNDYSPLIQSIFHRHDDITIWLLENGVDPNLSQQRIEGSNYDLPDRFNAFDIVCNNRIWSLIEYFHNADAKISNLMAIEDAEGLLVEACGRGMIWLAEMLVSQGIDPDDHPEDQPTPLIIAVQNGQLNVVQWLLQQNIDINYRHESLDAWGDWIWGGTALTAALENKHLEIAMELLNHGATPGESGVVGASDVQRYFGFSNVEIHPIFLCIAKKWNILLSKMLSVHKNSIYGITEDDVCYSPISFAIKANNFDAALMLIGLGHDVNEEVDGWTAVDVLVYESKRDFLPVLLDNGVSVIRKNLHTGEYVFTTLLKYFPEHREKIMSRLVEELDARFAEEEV